MPTAFQNWFVIITDCELPGTTPSDHDDAWSQFPLVGLIQEFTCAEAEVVRKVITNVRKHTVRRILAVRHIEVCIVGQVLEKMPIYTWSKSGTARGSRTPHCWDFRFQDLRFEILGKARNEGTERGAPLLKENPTR
jgi:hypothetical protein